MGRYDHDEDEREIADLRRQAERRALEVGIGMLDDPQTPATARASVVRALLGNAAARASEDVPVEVHQMTAAQLNRAMRRIEREIAGYQRRNGEIVDAEAVELPAPGVFD